MQNKKLRRMNSRAFKVQSSFRFLQMKTHVAALHHSVFGFFFLYISFSGLGNPSVEKVRKLWAADIKKFLLLSSLWSSAPGQMFVPGYPQRLSAHPLVLTWDGRELHGLIWSTRYCCCPWQEKVQAHAELSAGNSVSQFARRIHPWHGGWWWSWDQIWKPEPTPHIPNGHHC